MSKDAPPGQTEDWEAFVLYQPAAFFAAICGVFLVIYFSHKRGRIDLLVLKIMLDCCSLIVPKVLMM